ncbi:MAG: gamma-glutamyl-gamma-aminobutyrate hydrolase family protein [Candidatus Thiodiazotropha sp.]|nr:gamma-glutamyl-gamma-aminobutyrate hydrolase family protein [Candidatus Thiodiazotropha sp. (ex Lucina pensylvanica)]MBT3063076.1 gamma-glutamyl-gamma-aminobutyrate hydrolase family protein [Candidatus Thiodiazotropha sp. (ex Lucina pensylvanica)]MBV2096922.1 gamma-glutamyl-gamma-aminobutyrate hydrolase family protein [Candidatus Thiodiazotropha sp. (ex Codakia orbicularis)]PUB75754.1 MAG: amidotransferase [gamma proteobacterium symbiont of Ctena orbiculata]PUB77303.1 MAG: amidotransferase [
MRAHYLQHVPFEGLGSIEDWLLLSGYEITATRFFESPDLPRLEEIDLLIVMGGPMSVNDEHAYPWLAKEKNFIRSVIDAGKPVLGICLGAQLIAASLGSEIYPNSVKEIGWFPISAVKSIPDSLFRFPEETTVFHWHGETFDLPSGAVCTAKSKGCQNQAFQFGRKVIGLQFHLETTASSANAIVENCRDELVDGEYIQTEKEILSASHARYRTINRLMADILHYLLENSR